MKYIQSIAAVFLAVFSANVLAAKADMVVPELQKWAAHASVVAAVKKHNSTSMPLDEIKKIDKEWIAAKGKVAKANELMANEAAKYLKSQESKKSYLVESILTGNQGENVAITALTSDYWQGDEPKFVKAFHNGSGATYISRPKRDKSTNEIISQVSVPVMDGGKAIGTLTVGVIVSKL